MSGDVGHRPSVFISYRRDGGFMLAKYIYDHLGAQGFDVFVDVQTLGAGNFERTTLAEIAQRDCFIIILTAGSLDRMVDEADWLRKELTEAISHDATIIPVLDTGFSYNDPDVRRTLAVLPQRLRVLSSFNSLRIPEPEYFEAAMDRLISLLQSAEAVDKKPPPVQSDALMRAQDAVRDVELPSIVDLEQRRSTSWTALQEALLDTTPSGERVAAPKLREKFHTLRWDAVADAKEYVLELSSTPAFTEPEVVYEGRATTFSATLGVKSQPWSVAYYRVKVILLGSSIESEWSNVVRVDVDVSAATAMRSRERAWALGSSHDGEETRHWPYWRANVTLISALLVCWFVVSYVFGVMLVVPLNAVVINGFPLGFWFAQQGSIVVFVALIGVYAWRMNQIDAEYRSGRDAETDSAGAGRET